MRRLPDRYTRRAERARVRVVVSFDLLCYVRTYIVCVCVCSRREGKNNKTVAVVYNNIIHLYRTTTVYNVEYMCVLTSSSPSPLHDSGDDVSVCGESHICIISI